jgi:hypothetical protein
MTYSLIDSDKDLLLDGGQHREMGLACQIEKQLRDKAVAFAALWGVTF